MNTKKVTDAQCASNSIFFIKIYIYNIKLTCFNTFNIYYL